MKDLFVKKYWIYIICTALACNVLAADAPNEELLNTASIGYSRDTFNQGFDAWDFANVSIGRKFSWGSMTARVNHAERFGDKGKQFELDAYPKIREGTYMYLNVGWSNDDLFPNQRYGAEIYQSLPQSWEASLGLRRLNYSSHVNIYTGSVGKYSGNYYYLLRFNTVPDILGDSASANLQVRKYYGDEDYVAVTIGTGRSLSQLGTSSDVVALGSQRISIDSRFEVKPTWVLGLGLGLEKEEIRDEVFRNRTSYSIGIDKKF
jgi:YaiO family outer membrane protein